MQVKLLRVLQERKVRGVGETGGMNVDVRVLAATNRNVEEDAKNGKFRQDPHYRLNVIRIEMPAAPRAPRGRPELARHFLARIARARQAGAFAPDALRALDAYDFPATSASA